MESVIFRVNPVCSYLRGLGHAACAGAGGGSSELGCSCSGMGMFGCLGTANSLEPRESCQGEANRFKMETQIYVSLYMDGSLCLSVGIQTHGSFLMLRFGSWWTQLSTRGGDGRGF